MEAEGLCPLLIFTLIILLAYRKGGLLVKAFFRSKNFIVLAAVTCVLVPVIIYSACTGGGAISNIFGAVISPMQKVTAVATNNAQASLSEATRSYEDLAAENEQLKQQVNELNQQLVEFYQYKQEKCTTEKLFGIKKKIIPTINLYLHPLSTVTQITYTIRLHWTKEAMPG